VVALMQLPCLCGAYELAGQLAIDLHGSPHEYSFSGVRAPNMFCPVRIRQVWAAVISGIRQCEAQRSQDVVTSRVVNGQERMPDHPRFCGRIWRIDDIRGRQEHDPVPLGSDQ